MFQLNDTVLYGSNGVCTVDGTTVKNFSGKKIEYYVLKPLFSGNSTYFVPVDNEVLVSKIQRLMSRDEVDELLSSVKDESVEWNTDEHDRKRQFSEVITSGKRKDVMMVIKTIYQHKKELEESGKKLHMNDERVFRDAEKLLYDEFAVILDITPAEVPEYISRQLG